MAVNICLSAPKVSKAKKGKKSFTCKRKKLTVRFKEEEEEEENRVRIKFMTKPAACETNNHYKQLKLWYDP